MVPESLTLAAHEPGASGRARVDSLECLKAIDAFSLGNKYAPTELILLFLSWSMQLAKHPWVLCRELRRQ